MPWLCAVFADGIAEQNVRNVWTAYLWSGCYCLAVYNAPLLAASLVKVWIFAGLSGDCPRLSLRCGPRVIILWWELRLLLCMRGVRSHNSSTQFQTRMFPCQLDWIHHSLVKLNLCHLSLCVGVYWSRVGVTTGLLEARSREEWRYPERSRCDNDQAPDTLSCPRSFADFLYCPRDRDCDLLDTSSPCSTRDNSQSRFHVQVSGSQRWCECFVSLSDNSDLVLLNNFHYLVRCHFQWAPIESWTHHQHQVHFLMLLNCCTVSRFPSWKPCSNRMVWNYWQSLTTTVKIWRARPHPSRQYFSQSVFQRWTATLGINKITILWFIFFDWMVLQWNIGENFKQLNWH